jgi:hypothetical protein
LTQRKLKSRIHRYLITLAYIFQTIQLPLTAVSTIILSITFINVINKLLPLTGVINFFSESKCLLQLNFFFPQKQYYGLQYLTVERLPCLLRDDTPTLFFNCKYILSKAVIHNRINQVTCRLFYPAWLQGPARRFSEVLLDCLKVIITVILCQAPVIGCYTSPTRGVGCNIGRASGQCFSVEGKKKVFRLTKPSSGPVW